MLEFMLRFSFDKHFSEMDFSFPLSCIFYSRNFYSQLFAKLVQSKSSRFSLKFFWVFLSPYYQKLFHRIRKIFFMQHNIFRFIILLRFSLQNSLDFSFMHTRKLNWGKFSSFRIAENFAYLAKISLEKKSFTKLIYSSKKQNFIIKNL